MIFILKACVIHTSRFRSRKWAQIAIAIELYEKKKDVSENRQQSDAAPENEFRQSSIATDTIKTNTSPKMNRQNFAASAIRTRIKVNVS